MMLALVIYLYLCGIFVFAIGFAFITLSDVIDKKRSVQRHEIIMLILLSVLWCVAVPMIIITYIVTTALDWGENKS